MFPYLPGQSGYGKRLRRASGLITYMIRILAADTALWSDDVWVADSTPVECGRSRETVKRSALAGWAEHGYCASHSRYFWGLRLHLLCIPAPRPWQYMPHMSDYKESPQDRVKTSLEEFPRLRSRLSMPGSWSCFVATAGAVSAEVVAVQTVWLQRHAGRAAPRRSFKLLLRPTRKEPRAARWRPKPSSNGPWPPTGREAALRAFALACGMRIRAGEEDGTGLA
ncbi:MAG: hypothetical protein K0R62_4936 [Nonomuraea muscovyensis]|jgi:hypothetical protein|nr:hypothetical protein [Nonomuraea muscovyensis]